MHDRQELDQHHGAVAMLSLAQRGLIPPTGTGPAVEAEGRELADRVAGAVVGAACGSALGLPYEWRRDRHTAADPRTGARYAADVQLLVRSLELHFERGLEAPLALADWLGNEPYLRNPGNALPVVIDRLNAGTPWYEAGVGSFGAGAVVRAVAAGIAYRNDPVRRPIAAALDTVVTHATPAAVAAATTVAEAIAVLLSQPVGMPDASTVLDALDAHAADEMKPELAQVRAGVGHSNWLPSRAQACASVAAALSHALAGHSTPENAIRAAVDAGGDTDTVGALVGAFVGASAGLQALPPRWLRAVRGTDALVALATRIAGATPTPDREPADGDAANAVHISFLLDRSGSMAPIADDVVGGYNAFVRSQQRGVGDCSFTAVQFDSEDPFEVLVDDVDIAKVHTLADHAFQPRGSTPLFDALASLLDHAEGVEAQRRQLGQTARDQVVVVFTDGFENASRRYTSQVVFGRIDDLKAAGWTFVFLGANQDSYATGRALGVDRGNVSNWNDSPDGTRLAFASVDRASHSFREKARYARRSQRENFFEGIKEAENKRW